MAQAACTRQGRQPPRRVVLPHEPAVGPQVRHPPRHLTQNEGPLSSNLTNCGCPWCVCVVSHASCEVAEEPYNPAPDPQAHPTAPPTTGSLHSHRHREAWRVAHADGALCVLALFRWGQGGSRRVDPWRGRGQARQGTQLERHHLRLRRQGKTDALLLFHTLHIGVVC